ncbi:MAG: hypothetical protein KAS66_05460 [Candidatus Omnitrophica bacterium]|nr:hypothetical protein [Candidatus Omnitrophota bacterium]
MTPRQEQIFEFLKEYIRENGISPTYREIADGVGLTNSKTVSIHLGNMRESGHITWEPRKLRSIVLLGEWRTLGQALRREIEEIEFGRKEYISVVARDYGYNPEPPQWDDVLKGRRFDEPDMMVYPKSGNPRFIPHAN